MNGADFFRGLFGFRNPRFPSEGHNFSDDSSPDEGQEGPQDNFNFSWRGNWSSDSQDDLFGSHGDDTGSPQDIFGHFEEVFRQFDQLFSHGSHRMPFDALPGIPSNEEDEPSSHNPRDYMLKQPFQDPLAERQPHTDSITPPGFFGEIFGPRFETPKKEDKDLDSEVKEGDLSILFKDQEPSTSNPSMNSIAPMPEGGINRVQVYSFTNHNGGKEEKRTYKDETGTQVSTVTRTLGSQQYSHTTKTLPDGKQEHTEDFINMSDSDRDNFKRNWSNQVHGSNLDTGKNITQYVRDLFRIGFPGFPSK